MKMIKSGLLVIAFIVSIRLYLINAGNMPLVLQNDENLSYETQSLDLTIIRNKKGRYNFAFYHPLIKCDITISC